MTEECIIIVKNQGRVVQKIRGNSLETAALLAHAAGKDPDFRNSLLIAALSLVQAENEKSNTNENKDQG